MSSTSSCPSLKHLAKYAKGTLSQEGQELLLLHVGSCVACQQTIQTLRDVELQATSQQEPEQPQATEPVIKPDETQSAQSPSAASAQRSQTGDPSSLPIRRPNTGQPQRRGKAQRGGQAKQFVKAEPVQATPVKRPQPEVAATEVHKPKSTSPKKKKTADHQATAGKKSPQVADKVQRPSQKRRSFGWAKALGLIASLGLLGAGGYFGWRELQRRQHASSTPATGETVPAPDSGNTPAVDDAETPVLSNMLDPDEPIEKIRVVLTTGDQYADLNEPVDLHLGFGFPLRLHPLGRSEQKGFAAIAQKSSPIPENGIRAGEVAWFEFDAASTWEGNDSLKSTPQLLSGLQVGDISKIGFASPALSDWELRGYELEVNGKPLASNDAVRARPQQILAADAELAADSLPMHEVLSNQLEEYEFLDSAGYLTDDERQEWEEATRQVEQLERRLQLAGGKLIGQYPWYVDEGFAGQSGSRQSSAKPIEVTLVTSANAQSGTLNTVYLSVGGKKFKLASAIEPLKDGPEQHLFQISSLDLEQDYVDAEDLQAIGVGVIGGEHRFGKVPDRTRLDRVLVSVGGQLAYDSELNVDDRKTLSQIDLLPRAHVDDFGNVVTNVMSSDRERPYWQTGDRLAGSAEKLVTTASLVDNPGTASESSRPVEPEPPDISLPEPMTPPTSLDPTTPLSPIATSDSKPNRQGMASTTRSLVRQFPRRRIPSGFKAPGIGPRTTPFNYLYPILHALGSRPGSPTIWHTGVLPKPPASAVQLSDVQVHPLQANTVSDGDSVVVQWREINASSVAAYDVRLNAVLPHQHAAKKTLLVSKRILRRASVTSALLPDIKLKNIGLTADSRPHVFVEPEVIAIGNSGRPLKNGMSATGPLVPLHPKEWSLTKFRLSPGPNPAIDPADWIKTQIPASIVPGFQLGGDGYGHSPDSVNRWLPFSKPVKAVAGAWQLDSTNQQAVSGLLFGSYSTNVALRNMSDHVSLRFDAYPITLDKNLRLTGVLGFIDGDVISPNEAELKMRVIVQQVPSSKKPAPLQELKSKGKLNDNELLRITTKSSIQFSKSSGGKPKPLQLIDIPIPVGTAVKPPKDMQVLPGSGSLTAGSTVVISLTIMANQTRPVGNEALALFGLRLIPDP